jgi:uncharacterized protein YutE (UPF0331/DUF86 family)
VVFRVDAVQERLLRLEEVVSELRELTKLDRGVLRNMWAVERGLHLGAELLFDIGNHILSAQYGVNPRDYRDIIEQLARQGILAPALHQRLQGLAGFRNILVHDYIRLDPDRVEEALAKAPQDFSDFALAIRQLLQGQTAS